MELLKTRRDLNRLDAWRGSRPLVLVPTMGALHEGHLCLVRRAAAFGRVVVSIFVNPTQFGPNEDFNAYPRSLEGDLAQLENESVAAVFSPDRAEVYAGDGEVSVLPGRRSLGLCGASRPGHFAGVLTVVAKLFGLVRPDIAVFGRKDAQQCLVIGQMVADLKMPVRVVDVPTVRDADGLALSSRNRYLDADERRRALSLNRSLLRAQELLATGERQRGVLEEAMRNELEPFVEVEYAAARLVPDLEAPAMMTGTSLLAVAARVGSARLIDNLVLKVGSDEIAAGCLLEDGQNTQTED